VTASPPQRAHWAALAERIRRSHPSSTVDHSQGKYRTYSCFSTYGASRHDTTRQRSPASISRSGVRACVCVYLRRRVITIGRTPTRAEKTSLQSDVQRPTPIRLTSRRGPLAAGALERRRGSERRADAVSVTAGSNRARAATCVVTDARQQRCNDVWRSAGGVTMPST